MMFGLNQRGVNGYAKVSLETGVLVASPIKLIIMLYDGAITACHGAIKHMQQQDIANKGVMLSKAIMIIESGLRLSLDKRAGGEIALSLDALYAYMSRQLTLANINNKPESVTEVIKLLSELKSAWEAIENIQATAQSPSTAIPRAPGVSVGQTHAAVDSNITNYAKV